nr:cation-transporting P-type ATPase [Zoogloeaceae bacterium]
MLQTTDKAPDSIEQAHALAAADALARLDTTEAGLRRDEAARRLLRCGPNRLPATTRDGLLKRFFKHFHDILIYILLASAAVTALLGHWIDTGVILAVVIVNAVIGFIQEGKAEQALEGIRKMLSVHAQARRDGDWTEVEADTLVPGDIVRLRSGDRVPADM